MTAVGNSEQQEQGRRPPARAVLARLAVEQRRPALVACEIGEQPPVRRQGTGQSHRRAVALLEQRRRAAAAQHLLCGGRIRLCLQEERGRGVAPVGEHVESDVLSPGRQSVGLRLRFGLGAQIVDRPDAQGGEGLHVGALEPVKSGGAIRLTQRTGAAALRRPTAEITQVGYRGDGDALARFSGRRGHVDSPGSGHRMPPVVRSGLPEYRQRGRWPRVGDRHCTEYEETGPSPCIGCERDGPS